MNEHKYFANMRYKKQLMLSVLLWSGWILSVGAADQTKMQLKLGEESSELNWQVKVLEESIINLQKKYPDSYKGEHYFRRLNKLKRDVQAGYSFARKDLDELKKQALLAHPMLKDCTILGIKMALNRQIPKSQQSFDSMMSTIGLPAPHLSIGSVSKRALAGEIVKLTSIRSEVQEESIVKPEKGEPIAGLDLNWNGERLLFARRANDSWKIYEVNVNGLKKIVCIVSGYHDGNRCGYLGILDPSKGDRGDAPLVQIITGTPLGPKNIIEDKLTQSVLPLFTDPCPVDDEYFLVSVLTEEHSYEFGIYLVDVFGNFALIRNADGFAYLKPTLLRKRETPRVIPSQVDLEKDDATVYIQDVYVGPGLKGVKRGVIEKVRVVGYDYGYPTLAGVDKIGMTGPWDVMQMIGEAKVHEDGSAYFKIPADTPVTFQLIDKEGRAVQLMRTWATAMPGERMSCVGCHADGSIAASGRPTLALQGEPQDLDEWYGSMRGFDFAREIQPVLNKNCVSCHDGGNDSLDLRPKAQVPDYVGSVLSYSGFRRLNDKYKKLFDGKSMVAYTPAYESLIPYIRRVGVGDDVSFLVPGEYMANTSPLIQILKKGHHGLVLSAEDFERFYAWIDLNGPSHGTWKDVYGVTPADGMYELRRKYKNLYGSKQVNLDAPVKIAYDETPAKVKPVEKIPQVKVKGWPFDASRLKLKTKELKIGDGETITFKQLPTSAFVMGDAKGLQDEVPLAKVDIKKTFWMSQTEISNAQFRIFKLEHNSRYYGKRHIERSDNQGIPLDGDDQPALRVSWNDAMEFCKWLSAKTGRKINLPTEAQWEFACRAGSDKAFSFGDLDEDYSEFANVADKTFATAGLTGKSKRGLFEIASDLECLISEGVDLADRKFDDKKIVTAEINQYKPNAFGLKNMHGNVAEWTRSLYKSYPYDADDGRNDEHTAGDRVVRGGSFFDPPKRSRSAFRLAYPSWQKNHNVGFRIIIEGGVPQPLKSPK
ncbi:MAG: SUMF1/EgtB/PvdO family nonheme iron enzyme [Verrucomicrobiales bacterium]|nr:SUMF1/EgtB/PvdO family nonheme iron enzyme [Verrucomicrobiales bacterium]